MTSGLVHIYIGDGKGKTSAAVGLAVRALGAGLRVGIASFLKDGTSSEMTVLKTFQRCTLFPCPDSVSFSFCMNDEERCMLSAYYRERLSCVAAALGNFDVVILDEVLDATAVGLLDEAALITLLENRPRGTELVLTGHTLSDRLAPFADYITVMSAQRHPFNKGIAARRGIEY